MKFLSYNCIGIYCKYFYNIEYGIYSNAKQELQTIFVWIDSIGHTFTYYMIFHYITAFQLTLQ